MMHFVTENLQFLSKLRFNLDCRDNWVNQSVNSELYEIHRNSNL